MPHGMPDDSVCLTSPVTANMCIGLGWMACGIGGPISLGIIIPKTIANAWNGQALSEHFSTLFLGGVFATFSIGAWIVIAGERITVETDRGQRLIRVVRRTRWATQTQSHPYHTVREVHGETRGSDDGSVLGFDDPFMTHHIQIVPKHGPPLETGAWFKNREKARAIGERLANAIGCPCT